MSTLKEKAEEILTEKNEKIISDNIRPGIQIFDITGNYKPTLPSFTRLRAVEMFRDTLYDEGSIPVEYYNLLINNVFNRLDFSQVTDFVDMFSELYADTDSSRIYLNIDTSSGIRFDGMFSGSKIINFPQINMLNAVSVCYMFRGCEDLVDVPAHFINTSLDDITRAAESLDKTLEEYLHDNFMNNMFQNCPNLSNESLNNILAMISDIEFPLNKVQPPRAHWKTLDHLLGFSDNQCNTCTELPNWQACVELGWELREPVY